VKSWSKIGKPPTRSAYHRLQGCDCPDCAPDSAIGRALVWLDSPAGPWSTALIIAVTVALAAAWYWLLPLSTMISTAVTG
jgi:hypothetical protein